jgi:hypothetical protein
MFMEYVSPANSKAPEEMMLTGQAPHGLASIAPVPVDTMEPAPGARLTLAQKLAAKSTA